MANFPSIQKPAYGYDESFPDYLIESRSEGGYNVTRARNTRIPGKWKYTWPALPETNYQTLMTFWHDTVNGRSGIFVWTDPVTSTAYNVRFADVIKSVCNTPGYRQVEITIEEV